MSAYLLQQLLNGLMLGSLYALVAIGFSLIYSILRLINFAHGDLLMVGAFAALGTAALGGPWWAVAAIVVASGALAGIAIERVAIRPLRGMPQVTGFPTTLAVSVAIENLALILFTGQPRTFPVPELLRGQLELGPVRATRVDLVIILSTWLLLLVLLAVVRWTRFGRAMRALADNLLAARLVGVDVDRTILFAFALGSAFAAYAGLLWGGRFGQVDPLMGFAPGLKAFVACVLGGVGSLAGAVLGGYLLGFAEVLFVGLLPPAYSGLRDAFVFAGLILLLLFLPNGLLGRSEEERA